MFVRAKFIVIHQCACCDDLALGCFRYKTQTHQLQPEHEQPMWQVGVILIRANQTHNDSKSLSCGFPLRTLLSCCYIGSAQPCTRKAAQLDCSCWFVQLMAACLKDPWSNFRAPNCGVMWDWRTWHSTLNPNLFVLKPSDWCNIARGQELR